MIKLDIGCEKVKQDGYVGIDIIKYDCVDIISDCQNIPIQDNTVSEIYISHLVEHLDIDKAFKEFARILEPEGMIEIYMPHYSNRTSWNTPEHIHHPALGFFRHTKDFEVVEERLIWMIHNSRRPRTIKKIISYPLNFIASRFPNFTERILLYYVGGYEEVYFKLKKKVE